jgi:aspartyl-tRNA(Asn)/glutamyl-tRNA(Gln) amidotransferase subunit A
MSQLCYNPYGFNDDYGRCCNPWGLDRISGGSSSGSAAAVAAGIIFGALGSDTGGSIRLPAAMCGVVGLLPTRGRVSVKGLVPLAFSLDNVGPIARNIRDCGRLLGVIAGRDPLDRCSSDAPVPNYEADLFGRSIRRKIEDSLDVYRSLGCAITRIEIPDFDEINAFADVIELSEIASIYGMTYREHKDKIHPILRDRIEIGLGIPAAEYFEARDLRDQKVKRFINHVFDVVEVMLLPVTPTVAPKAVDISSQLTENPDANMELVGRMTQFANYLGVPALSVPCGFSLDRLPIAFQLVGPPFSESILFQIGHAFESVTEHHLRGLDAAALELL